MKFLFIFIGIYFLVSCQTTKPCQDCAEDLVLVHSQAMKPVFEDGTKVEKAWTGDRGMFFYREGRTAEGDCRITRTPTKIKDGLLFMRLAGATESCSGITCEHCAFRKSGGCECKNIGQGVCTHTISKNRDLFRLE